MIRLVWSFVWLRLAFSLYDDELQVFPYKPDKMCQVHYAQQRHMIWVNLRSIKNFEASYPIVIALSNETSEPVVLACFERRGQSHLWMESPNQSLLYRGGQLNPAASLGARLASYDQYGDAMYAVINRTVFRMEYEEWMRLWRSESPSMEAVQVIPTWYNDSALVVQRFVANDGRVFLVDVDGRILMYDANELRVVDAIHESVVHVMADAARSVDERLSYGLPTVTLYCMNLSLIVFLVYCMRYKLVVRQNGLGGFELSPSKPG